MATQPTLSDFLRSGAVVRAPGGAPFRVSPLHAGRFGGLLSDLEESGIRIDPAQSGGFANRNIAGTSVPSQHSFGRAVDVNWNANPRGPMDPMAEMTPYETDIEAPTRIPPQIARELAQRHGMAWGGDWRNPDPMHFEVGRGDLPPVPVPQRSFTAFAGAQPPATAPTPQPQPPPVVPPPHSATPQPAPAPQPTEAIHEAQFTPTGQNPFANFRPISPQMDPLAASLLNAPPPVSSPSPQWISNPFQQRNPSMARFNGLFG